MFILINRNMSCEHVRPTTNRSGTLLMSGEMKCIKFFGILKFLSDLSQFLSKFKSFKPLDKEIFN